MSAPRRADPRAIAGGTLLVVIAALALFAPLVAGADPSAQRDVVATRFLPPLATDLHGVFHPLGTDRLGRDVWARLVHGARISLSVGVLTMALSLGLGTLVGLLAAIGRGAVRAVLLALTDFALGVPRVVLLLLLAALWNPGLTQVVLVLAVTGWMPIARLVYAEARAQLARPYVEGAIALGAGRRRLLLRHVLPHLVTPVLAALTLGIGQAITLEAGLSFLGLGVQPPTPSWGALIASGRDSVVNAPWVGLAPGVMLVLVVVGCTLLADAVQERGGRA